MATRGLFRNLCAMLTVAVLTTAAHPSQAQCVGDCDSDGQVTVDEIVRGVAIALGNVSLAQCLVFDANGDQQVTVEELVRAIQNALNGCPIVPTPTAPEATATATLAATATATETAEIGTPTATSVPNTATPTSTATPTATATATATIPVVMCGDGLLEPSESCEICPADCQAASCSASGRYLFEVGYSGSRSATSLAVLVTYRSSSMSLPGSANQATVGQRVTERPSGTFVVNDLNYALRVVLGGSSPKPAGKLFAVDFDGCQTMPPPGANDVRCIVEGCSDGFGRINDCACTVTPR